MIAAAPTMLGAAAWRFASPGVLLLLLVLPVAAILLWLAFVSARRALVTFSGQTPQSTRPSPARAATKLCLIVAGAGSLMFALARPQADPVEESVTVRGRDVVFIVDVSRSMLSRDAVPNRLSRAKLWINDLVNTLRGDRVGLVAFAGAAVVKSPLTMDYGFFRMALDELSPASVPRGGTMIGDAIRKAMNDVFEPGPGRYRDIVLITDGEDQGSFPTEAAKQAAEQGVRLIVIGIGSEVEGAPVPAEERADQKFVEYQGERVRSRLDQTTLAAIAEAASRAAGESGGGGVFLNVGTGTMDLDKVYHDLVGSADQRETETKSNVLYRELFPYFLLIAGACLAIEPMIGGRVRTRLESKPASGPASGPSSGLAVNRVSGAALTGAVVCASLLGQVARAADAPEATQAKAPVPATAPQTPDSLYNTGRELFAAGKFAEAAQHFRDADLQTTDAELSARARFNLGQALLKQASPPSGAPSSAKPEETKARLEAAAQAFRSAYESKPDDTEAARNVEIARRMLKDFEEQQKKQEEQSKNEQSKDGESNEQNQDKSKDQQKQDQQSKGGKQDQKDQGGQQSGDAGEQNQQNADKLKDLAEQQRNAADQTKKAGEQQDAKKRNDERQKAEQDQQSVSEKTEQQQKESSKSAGDDARQKMDAARKEQQAAQDAMKQGDDKKAEQHQRNASEMLREAAQAEQRKADQAREQQAEEDKAKQGDPKEQGKDAQKQEPKYDQTASQLLDKERKERDARQQILRALRGRPVPVEKDW